MKNTVNTWIEQIRQDHRRKLNLAMVLAAFAILVAGVVFWQLHTTGVAMSNEVYCGMEEHVHDESCYEQVLTCGLEESEGHVHDENCYETAAALVCTDDSAEHVHTEDCYETVQELVCGLEESEGHTHTDACYETVLTCQIPEHTHTIDCMVDETADVETAADWEATLPEELSDDIAENIAAVAESQIGYTESEKNFILAEDGETRQGYTRYGAWYGNEYGDWDAMFASFCLNYAGISEEDVPYGSGAWSWMTALGDAGLYEENAEPAAGDLVFLDTDSDGQAETVAVVTGVSDVALTVVQGNSEDAVEQYSLYLSDDAIIGYSDPASRVMPLASTVLASGTIDNAAGDPDAISWVLEEDDVGSRTLTISGDGAIPDCTSSTASDLPWNAYFGTSTKIVFAGNITRIGNYSFSGAKMTELEFLQETDLVIGSYAFYYGSLGSVHFPGTVKEIEASAFSYTGVGYIEFDEGIETIGNNAFGYTQTAGSTDSPVIYIPASLTSIGTSVFTYVSAYVVSENNPAYCADEDGVLYSKDMTVLVDYPKCREAGSWTVPACVETINAGALACIYTSAIYILNSEVTLKGEFAQTGVQRVYFADGVQLSGADRSLFYASSSVVDTRLPENTKLTISLNGFQGTALTSLKIPNGTVEIKSSALTGMSELETLYYDAENAKLASSIVTDSTGTYDLIIGSSVNLLPENFGNLVSHATSLSFIGENVLYITPGELDDAPAPYTGLSGWIYVEADGVIYRLDPDTGTAELYYIPENSTHDHVTEYVDPTYEGEYTLTFSTIVTETVTSVTVPAAITVGEITVNGETISGSFTVTTVASDAAKDASGLTSITFGDASAVTLEDYALANCPLASVTDLASGTTTTVEEYAEDLFKDTGFRVFYNTDLEGAENNRAFKEDMDGAVLLEIEDTDESGRSTGDTFYINIVGGTWQQSENGDGGGYTLLTGEQLTVDVLTEASDSGSEEIVYRVYFQFTDENGTLLLPEGTEWGETYTATTENGSYTFKYCRTDDPLTCYLELDLGDESTGTAIMFDVGLEYPIPTAGGGVTIWGEIAEKGSDAGDYPSVPDDSYAYIQAYWDTDPVVMAVTKANTSNQTSVDLTADADGVYFSKSLNYTITTSYEESGSYGKDYVKEVTYEDILELPNGVTWDAEVLALIEAGECYTSGNNLVVYIDNSRVTIATVQCSTTGVTLTSARLSVNEDGDVVLSWRIKNSGDGEIPVTSTSVSFAIAAFTVDPEELSEVEEKTITNTVTGTVHYTYADPVDSEDYVEKTINVQDGTISLSKSNITTASYFGEDWTYALTVSNPRAMPWTATTGGEGAWTLSDTLDAHLYISAANMEKMFEEAAADSVADLTITITGAELGTASMATAVDGETEVTLDTANSDIPDATTDNTITITCSGTAGDLTYTVSVEDGTTETGNSLQALLDRIGYGVTYTAQYSLEWTLGNENEYFSLRAGESHVFTIYSTVKDTFQQLAVDNPGEFGSVSSTINSNKAYLYRADNSSQTNASSNGKEVTREALIQKSMVNLTTGTTSPNASSGDVLEYTLSFEHSGNGVYEDLPMVDDLEGEQLLLVPVKENEGNEGLAELEKMTVEGTEYYILTPGTYSGVYVGLSGGEYLYTDSITVEENSDDSGYHTQIKWYFSFFSASSMDVTYLAVASYKENQTIHSINNTVWMNDKTDDRIYSSLWGGGTPLGFGKDIVLSKGTDADGDTLAEDGYSRVEQGEEVTYRLTLSNDTDGQTLSLGGANMADSLPATYDDFEWIKEENITLSAVAVDTKEVGKITITAGGATLYESGDADFTTDAAAAALADYWTIGDTYYSISGCYMLWDSDLTFTFENECTLYLYVTLTFPSNDDDGSTWSDYARDAGGNPIYNTLYISRFSESVSHDLAEPGEVLLQKGIYALARRDSMYANTTRYIPTGNTRYVFNNKDSSERYVIYYVTLYNGGNVRYYLSDITDSLPDGLTFVRMVGTTSGLFGGYNAYNYSTPKTIDTVYGTSTGNLLATVAADSGVVYRSAHVEMISANTTGEITFSLSAGSDFTYALQYDEERGMYYLDRDEAVVFGYMCSVGSADETGDEITNGVSMDYYDYLGMGIDGQISDDDAAVNVADVTYNGENIYLNTNDGKRTVQGDRGEQQSLTSSVTLVRGEIQPGVEKKVDETTEQIYGTEPVYWTTRLTNGGEAAMINYTYTDTMQAPFVFEGDMNIVFYGGDGKAITSKMTLFSIGERSENDEILTVTSSGVEYQLEIGGDPVDVTSSSSVSGVGTVTILARLSISRDSSGNEVLTLVFEGEGSSLQESGGYLELTYSTQNPGHEISSGATYVNTARVTPTQPFEKQYEGSITRDENNDPVSVYDYASTTVTMNNSTTAWKSVTEVAEDGTLTDNTGSTSSTAVTDKIVLDDASNKFVYTLNVRNDTSYHMSRLVLLDDLPYVGDTCAYNDSLVRGSEFAVLLESDKFTVTVTTEDGTVTTLDPEYYTVQVSETKRGNFTTEDHDGTSTDDWEDISQCDDLSKVETIRVIIEETEDSGELIPAGSTVSVSFTCVAKLDKDDEGNEARSAETAWNNFGYHFTLGTGSMNIEMEAMPLLVGVEIPSIPELTKTTLDLKGGEYNVAEENTTFTFVVYEGDELTDVNGKSYETMDELLAALEALEDTDDARQWRVVTLTVEEGESASDTMTLTGSNGLSADDETWWKWIDGDEYTIVEFDTDEYYQFQWKNGSSIGTEKNSYTFQYDSSVTLELSCSNICQIWEIDLQKVDSTDDTKVLPGAVFALYSPDAEDLIGGAEEDSDTYTYQTEDGRSVEVPLKVTRNGTTWYLCSVKTSDENGEIVWDNLTRDAYYLTEVLAPDGYYGGFEPSILHKDDVSVRNDYALGKDYTGSVFAAYSLYEEDMIPDVEEGATTYKYKTEDGRKVKVPLTIEVEVEDTTGDDEPGVTVITMYLCSVAEVDDNGRLSGNWMDRDEYYLKEVLAQKGSSITFESEFVTRRDVSVRNYYSLEAGNQPGVELPMTGGIGTWIFYAAGAVLAGGAAVILIRRRRING